MRSRPLTFLGAAFLLTAVYLFFAVSLHEVTSWLVALIVGIFLVILDLELKNLKDRLTKLEAGTSAAVAVDTERV